VRPIRELAGELSGDDLAWDATADVRITQDVTIPAGQALSIAAGTRVGIAGKASIHVKGRIDANGLAENPVLFAPASDGKPWGGLRILGGTAALNHAWFTGGGGDATLAVGHSGSQPVIYVENGTLAMTGGGVADNPGKGFGSQNAHLALTGVLDTRNDTGGELMNSQATIEGCRFLEFPDADGQVDDEDNDGIYLVGTLATDGVPEPTVVRDCVFARGEDDGIDHNGARVRVEGTWIEGFYHEGVAASTGQRIEIVDTVVSGCEQGIEAGYGAPEVVVDHCLVTGNDTGFRYGDSYDWDVTGTLTVTNSVSVGNRQHNVWNHVNNLNGPREGAIAIACSRVDSPDFDGANGNLPGVPSWDPDGCVAAEGLPVSEPPCNGTTPGPRGCD
jgi:hypothetical protein